MGVGRRELPDSDMEDLLNSGLEVAGDGDGQGRRVIALLDRLMLCLGTQGDSELGLGSTKRTRAGCVVIHGASPPGAW